ncbi:transcriptional regulator, ArsR family [Paenibacillus curdlanolyticus YK9]|uniref:Transcriptional regulator, ArsR family n=1 Tax=Paenibacillus curdlanolyticus YK9 TaxID=717606 RepID=E0IF95_9BACL|nr:ArsR family transcriptional regulator [Paenibacillus curdlanolyticus]EFM08871.1 transcriptional regulator, ArsR family [Paenibacillus curdlanolyticus YK9]
MKIDTTLHSLPIYEALASNVRLQVINLLARQDMNIKELAQATGLSSAIMTMHVKKLEKAGIVQATMIPSKGGIKKVCSLVAEAITIDFPRKCDSSSGRTYHQTVVSVGHYTDFEIEPTCGLATTEKVIGEFDEPRCFLDAQRFNAKIVWFGRGFIEYKVPNYLLKDEMPEELEISMEISSVAPFVSQSWPSDIAFHLNGVEVGIWTSPGDIGGKRGNFTPNWWSDEVNQHGLLKVIKINESGTSIDGNQISNVSINDLKTREKQWNFRISVKEDSPRAGGVTLFGSGFGNYNQDLVFKLYYQQSEVPAAKAIDEAADRTAACN